MLPALCMLGAALALAPACARTQSAPANSARHAANAATAKPSAKQRPAYEPKRLDDVANGRLVNVEQLDEALRESHGRSDRAIASQLSRLVLTQRFSLRRLHQWQPRLPGKRSRQALEVLSDASTFLKLPRTDELALPPPSICDQDKIFSHVIISVAKNLKLLPDFIATRTADQFEATDPYMRKAGERPVWQHLSTRKAMVRYESRRGDSSPANQSGPHPSYTQGIRVHGIFGPTLVTAVRDAAHGKVVWSHWEQGESGPVAVFHYSVDEKHSHYSVGFWALKGTPAGPTAGRQQTAYHGEIATDPSSGNVIRLTLEADIDPSLPVSRSDIAVDYSPVSIGGRAYMCPVHSVAIGSSWRIVTDRNGNITGYGDSFTSLSQETFANYHIFRSDSRILSGHPSGPERRH